MSASGLGAGFEICQTTLMRDIRVAQPRYRHRGGVTVTVTVMHYPRRISLIKRKRKSGFRTRMRTHNGRKTINRKRRVGRRVSVV